MKAGVVAGIIIGIVITIIAVALILGLGLSNSHSPLLFPAPATSVTCTTTITTSVFGFTAQTVQANHYVYQQASLTTGQSVSISYSADNTVDVYVLSSSQYSLYNGGTTSNDITGATGQSAGTLSFTVGFDDTYYVVVFNPHNGFFGLGSQPIGIYSVSGTATQVSSYTTTASC